ncbi:hypothetical protein GCM10008938_45960 [Deinococcus roseus]|uniref:Transposase n=1 Tax=Deinococcus roseus TaxID=392414 RepID=A0ABQ2DDY1_9DEIO|nr:hypothetical protein GCM10008938_45960 [Deinococcus roseus]
MDPECRALPEGALSFILGHHVFLMIVCVLSPTRIPGMYNGPMDLEQKERLMHLLIQRANQYSKGLLWLALWGI